MKIVILPQVASNKGDRAILHFMLQELIDSGVTDITVSTTQPHLWEDYRVFNGTKVKFIQHAWFVYSNAESKVPHKSLRYYCLKILSRIRAYIYGRMGYSLLRAAVVKQRYCLATKLMCHLCNRELWNAINDADAVVTTGGHRITTLLQPDVIGHQTFSMAMVVLASKKLYLWSQTIGGFSFKKEINRRLVQTILEHSSKIYIRDEESANHVRALIGNSSKLYKTYDSVFGLKPCSAEPSGLLPSKRESIVGISVYTGISNREIDYHQYIESMAGLVKHVVTNGYRVKFFPMHLSDKREHNYFEEMVKRSGCKDSCEIVDASISTEKHLRELAGCRVFVGHKTHSIIFALTTDTPLVAIAYHVKTMDFMKQFELDEYSFMESEITPSKLIAVFDNVVSNLDNVYIAEQKKSKIMCEKVKEDFRRLIADLASQACLLAKA